MATKKEKVNDQQEPYNFKEERFEVIGGVRYDFAAAPRIRHQQLVTLFSKKIEETCASDGLVLTTRIRNEDNLFGILLIP